METFQWFINEVKNQFFFAAGSIIWNTVLFALAGLVAGIALVVIGHKRKWFKRDVAVWSFFAKLNYGYLPGLLMVFGGVTGSFYGVKKTADRFVEKTATPLAHYAQEYASNIRAYLPDPQWEREEDMTLEEVIAQGLSEKGGLEPGSIASMAATAINIAIAEHLLDEYGVPELVRDPIGTVRVLREASYQAAMFSSMTPKLQSVCGHFIWLKYKLVLFVFLPFLLLPLGEFFLHLAFLWVRGRVFNCRTTNMGSSQFVMLLVLVLSTMACSKGDDMPPASNYLGAKLNGQAFECKIPSAGYTESFINGETIHQLFITGFENDDIVERNSFSVILTSTSDITATGYASSGRCEFITSFCANILYFNDSDQKFQYGNASTLSQTQIIITSLDLSFGGRVEGTFSGRIEEETTGEIIEVSEGKFSAEIL